ncbi:MAG: TrkA family potassium uptake protein [Haloarculaceae archaeon]
MKFVIVGFGRVGKRTARILQSEGHAVVVVEQAPEKVAAARDEGFAVIEGDAEAETTLERAGLEETDAVGALTGDLNANYAVCMIATEYDCRTVLRIDEDYREEIYATYAGDVDEIVYPERLGAAGAKNALLGGDLNALSELTETLTATTVDVPADSPVVGQRVVEIEPPDGARIYAHGRRNEPMTIPLPQTTVEAGDQVAFIATPTALADMKALLRGTSA